MIKPIKCNFLPFNERLKIEEIGTRRIVLDYKGNFIESGDPNSIDDAEWLADMHNIEDPMTVTYNCMGYAFNENDCYDSLGMNADETEEYYDALVEDIFFEMDGTEGCENIGEAIFYDYFLNDDLVVDYLAMKMLSAFSDLRIIESLDEIKQNEYGIAFATSTYDFHFVKIEGTTISHKMGFQDIERLQSIDEGFGDRYNSKRIFFAKKKGV